MGLGLCRGGPLFCMQVLHPWEYSAGREGKAVCYLNTSSWPFYNQLAIDGSVFLL